ncbi:PIN domain-containing protein [Streptomyces sp. CB01881]|uniref:PIN domain-containing protein n=1 Tax=Streptomyces sp. CB01881 TaxID=2078691 RepID=UPI000CDBFDD9|nr:PIN domain-containing protein [Streptomyces sp. CB01881]AUY49747.1 PIN domain-containing protein [Streptomyces sp. CB01881]TYC73137.1 PIN domain-containing protein [Streptomyces sp. CB01881]
MAFVVAYDSCVLHPNVVRDLLIRVAQAGMVQAKWSEQILDEMSRALHEQRGTEPDKLQRLRQLMNDSIRDVCVTGYEPLVEMLKLPDPDDRHVLAAAIRSKAQVIVTDNRKDFPPATLAEWGVEPKSADSFFLDLLGLDDRIIYACVQQIAESRRNPPESVDGILEHMERSGLRRTVAALRMGPGSVSQLTDEADE